MAIVFMRLVRLKTLQTAPVISELERLRQEFEANEGYKWRLWVRSITNSGQT